MRGMLALMSLDVPLLRLRLAATANGLPFTLAMGRSLGASTMELRSYLDRRKVSLETKLYS